MESIESRSDTRHTVIPAPPAAVFAAISAPDRIGRWWGPEGFTSTVHTFEFTPGGRWLLTMHGPDGTDYPNQNVFTRLEADRLFEIEHLSDRHHFILTIELHPQTGDGAGPEAPLGTEVRWRQTFDTAEHYQQIAAFIATANQQNLDRLAAEVARAPVQPDGAA